MVQPNHKFIQYMSQRPNLYEASTSAFWDDENISKYMLEAHLNPDWDAASRKHSFIKESVEWITKVCGGKDAVNKKKLLDLGCGPGIYADLLCEKGFEVTGVDLSRRSIQYAKDHAKEADKKITYKCQNYLELEYENMFDAAILIYCDFGVLSPKDRERLLYKIRLALKEDGILILDGWAKKYREHFKEMQTVQYEESGFWSSDPYVCVERNFLYRETDNTLDQYLIVKEDGCECYNTWNQIFSEESLSAELQNAGFKESEFYDDVAGKKFTGEEDTICVIARK